MSKTSVGNAIGRFLLALAFLMGGVEFADAQQKEKLSIELDWSPTGMHAGLHLAQQKGWYEAAGLTVQIADGKGSTGTIQHIAAGQYDVGFAGLGAMAAGVSNGMPLTSVACFQRASDYGLMVPANSPWQKLQDLKGKKIAMMSVAGVASFFDPYAKASGMSRNDFQIISVDPSVLMSTYNTGGSDAAVSTVAFFLPIVENVRPSKGILMSDAGLNVPGFGFVVRKQDVDAKASALRKLIEVNQKAWAYILASHEDEGVDAIMKERTDLRLDRNIMMGQLKAYMRFFDTPATKGKPIGWQAESDWVEAIAAMEGVGMVKPGLKPADVYTNKLIAN